MVINSQSVAARTSERLRAPYRYAVYAWLAVALLFVFMAMRPSALVIAPISLFLWYAARPEKLKQTAQMVWPILLLPGAVLCFVGAMQSMNYGRMENEPDTQFVVARLAFFIVGLVLHAIALWMVATESRAVDHPSGDIADKI
jgi:hypothetical protein